MTQIVLKGNHCQIVGETDLNHLLALDKALSFQVQGAEHTAAYRGYFNRAGDFVKWDGFRRLLASNGTFSAGLLSRVEEFYKNTNKAYTIVDKRAARSVGTPRNILDKLAKLEKNPYPYQLEILDVIDKNDRGIIKVATGGGKSLIAALIAAHLGKKTIIYVIGKDLLYQFHKFFSEVFNEPIGIIGDGKCEIHDINIASIWTVGQALGMKKQEILFDADDNDEKELSQNKYKDIIKMLKDSKVHIIDECHMSACETIQQVYKNISIEHFYGLSGSPWRDDGADLLVEAVLGQYIVNISASYLIERGFLAQPIISFRVVPFYTKPLEKVYQSVYKKYVVENDIRNDMVLDAAKTLVGKGYQTLVLFKSLKHGKILYKMFSQELNCAMLDGSDDQATRDQVKQDLLNGKIDCILASKIFDIGVDIPSLSGLVLACGGKSTVKALQRVGRVIRKHKTKKFAAVVEFVDQAPFLLEHSKIRYKIYKSEKGFQVTWPGKKKKTEAT